MSKWIKCSERMPDRQEQGYMTYIVASWDHIRKIYHVGTYDWRNDSFQDSNGEKILMDDGYWIITHWQALPDAPEKE